jgi:DNA replication protein DnaC
MSSLTDPLGPDLTATLRALKLGKLTATLPERLTLARQHNMPHADFLQLILSDEVARREAGSIALRAKNAGLDPAMRTETWDTAAAIRYDQRLWNELISLRFLDGPHGALILGPVGVGKTHLATALGHIAVRRRRTVAMARADKLFKRLTAARLDNTLDYEYRRLTTVELLIIDDFALQPLTPAQTTDFYEIITERHRKASTVVTSNRDASKAHMFARTYARCQLKRDMFGPRGAEGRGGAGISVPTVAARFPTSSSPAWSGSFPAAVPVI